jgi:hypothetical protein
LKTAIEKTQPGDLNEFRGQQKIYWVLRISSAMCFIGHGAFGIITKSVWCNYFALFGIGHDLAYELMPLVGSLDILFGLSLLFYPTRAVLSWLVIWGFATACMRPLSGESFAECIERAGNFGAPLSLLFMFGNWRGLRDCFILIRPDDLLNARRMIQMVNCLRVVTFLLFMGHGFLNIIGKKSLLIQYSSLGFTHPSSVSITIGTLEISSALILLFRPRAPLLIALILWKMTSELFYPHYEVFEWIERAGSYGTLIALFFAIRMYAAYPQLPKRTPIYLRGLRIEN